MRLTCGTEMVDDAPDGTREVEDRARRRGFLFFGGLMALGGLALSCVGLIYWALVRSHPDLACWGQETTALLTLVQGVYLLVFGIVGMARTRIDSARGGLAMVAAVGAMLLAWAGAFMGSSCSGAAVIPVAVGCLLCVASGALLFSRRS